MRALWIGLYLVSVWLFFHNAMNTRKKKNNNKKKTQKKKTTVKTHFVFIFREEIRRPPSCLPAAAAITPHTKSLCQYILFMNWNLIFDVHRGMKLKVYFLPKFMIHCVRFRCRILIARVCDILTVLIFSFNTNGSLYVLCFVYILFRFTHYWGKGWIILRIPSNHIL